jgi:uncharacterized protein YbjT (DUF2867 family)
MLILILTTILASLNCLYALQCATVFGATGGVGQLICKQLLKDGYKVRAISRDVETAKKFELLTGCEFKRADARIPSTLIDGVMDGSDVVVISVGTTAFPTQKWKDGNDPKAACVDTVVNICDAIDNLKVKPSKVVLLSSIGVERRNEVKQMCIYVCV